MIDSVCSISVILKPKLLVLLSVFINYPIAIFINFAVSVISMSNNVYFIQYHFNIIPLTCNSNIVGWLINRTRKRFFWSALRQLMTSIYSRLGLNLDGFILVFSFETFLCQPLLNISNMLNIVVYVYSLKTRFSCSVSNKYKIVKILFT